MTKDKIEALRKIKALLDEGAISQIEFDTLKSEILNPSANKSATEPTESNQKPDKREVIAKNKTKDAQIEKKADKSPERKSTQKVRPETRPDSEKNPIKKATIGSELKSKQKRNPRNKDKSNSATGKRITNSPKEKPGGEVKFVLTPTSPSSQGESIELEIETNKKQRNKPSKLVLIGILSICAVTMVVFGTINGWFGSNNTSDSVQQAKYVYCSKLALYSSPFQSEYTKRIVSGDSVGFIKDSTIGNLQWTKLNYRGDLFWAKTSKYGIQYLVNKTEIEDYQSIFSGTYVQQVHEEMPAYAKKALMKFCKDHEHREYRIHSNESNELLPVAYFRSRIGNRSKSTDKARGINMGLKDMAVLLTASYMLETDLVVFSFDEDGQSQVIFERTISGDPVGLKRVKRRTRQRFSSTYSYEEERLILDGVIVVFASDGWARQNEKLLYRRDLNGGLNLYKMY